MTTWMRQELHEAPARIEHLLGVVDADLDPIVASIRATRPRWAMLVARGTSDCAAVYGRYLIETELGLPTGLAAPSVVTIYDARLDWAGGLIIGVTQSGRSPDLVAFVEAARMAGALTVAVTNDPRSPLAESAAFTVDCRAGPEHAVAATKSYLAELVVLAALVGRLADAPVIRAGLGVVPDALRGALKAGAAWVEGSGVVDELATIDRALVASRGLEMATALEVALKLGEIAGVFAAGYSAADLEHGPIALAGPGTAALVIQPDGVLGASVNVVVERLRRAGADPWVIARDGAAAGPRTLRLASDLPAALQPITSVVPGELLAEAVARCRGLDPDAPAGLTKVTLTR